MLEKVTSIDTFS